MGCACKSNTGAKKQASQVTKRSTTAPPPTHAVNRATPTNTRKQIVIRRPVR
jgi:hypothetical protein